MLQIADLTFATPFVLAPLAGYSDLPLRLLCRRFGAGYCISEMISCHGLVYGQQNSLKLLASTPEERPVSFQLFGADPEAMADAAEIMAAHCPDMIDINMGCPVKKVTKRGAGAALMTNRKLAEKILQKVVAKVAIPITVKIRSGKDFNTINAVSFAKMAEDNGATAVTVHARTWSQGFSGQIDKNVIAEVKKSVHIPIVGNGDILSHSQGLKLMAETGCDGVMIGRAALGNPWVFMETGRPENFREIVVGAREHLRLIETLFPTDRFLGHIKSQLAPYFKGLPGSAVARTRIFAAESLQMLKETIDSYALKT
jgi:tRNA-dihydrouridine synthase B